MRTYLLNIYQWTMVSRCYSKSYLNAQSAVEMKLWTQAVNLYHYTVDYRIF